MKTRYELYVPTELNADDFRVQPTLRYFKSMIDGERYMIKALNMRKGYNGDTLAEIRNRDRIEYNFNGRMLGVRKNQFVA